MDETAQAVSSHHSKIVGTLTFVGRPGILLSVEQILHGGEAVLQSRGTDILHYLKIRETQDLLDIFTNMKYTTSRVRILVPSDASSSLV